MALKAAFLILGLGILVIGYLLFVDTLATAYLSPDKSVIIYVNRYNEGTLEYISLFLFAPAVIYFIFYSIRKILTEEN